jgi:polyhydroxybutyrate depolymerase
MKKMASLLRSILLGVFILLGLAVMTWFLAINRTNGTIISAGERRSYLLYVPESYDPSKPAPLVITIHGFAQWPAHQMQITRWNDLADEYGFIAVYPAGTRFPLRWRIVGEAGTSLDPMRDVTFISDLIAKLEAEYNIDPARIYANGLSNGGGMSFLLSCEMSDRIAAIGTVAGAFTFQWEDCQPSRPVPTMVFHGTADPIVPYAGGQYHDTDIRFPSISEWVAALAQRNGCMSEPAEIPASGQVSGVRYTGCAADVVFYTITGSGHTWPGGEPIPEWIAGMTSQDIDATRTLWEFFQSHPLPVGQAVP